MEGLFSLLVADSLTRLVFLPALACIPLLFLGRTPTRWIKVYALVVSLLLLVLTAWHLVASFDPSAMATESADWIPAFGISYSLGMDGISMPLVALTVLLLPVVLLGSWREIETNWAAYAGSLFLLTTGILGALLALDLFLFYVFWELMLVPMYLVIGVWGGERRIYAAVKFFLYTMVGSLFMLVGILWLAWTHFRLTGEWSFAYADFLRLDLPLSSQLWLFAAFALAFAIKVPLFPLHTWLPDAHVEAPTGGSVVLAGVLLKLGTYGFLRFAFPLFPHAAREAQGPLIWLAVTGVLYGALVAWVQEDMKRLVAYSSVAHLGFVMLGMMAFDQLAWEGSLIQMVNHGLSTGALFLLVGMLYDRRHTKLFADYGGIARVVPVFAFFLVFSALASVGLPGLNGFVGEFLILAGAFRAQLIWPVVASSFGVVLAAVYLFKMLSRTLWGPLTQEANRNLQDLGGREIAALAPLCLLMLLIGLFPESFMAPSRPALEGVLARYEERVSVPPPESPAILREAGR